MGAEEALVVVVVVAAGATGLCKVHLTRGGLGGQGGRMGQSTRGPLRHRSRDEEASGPQARRVVTAAPALVIVPAHSDSNPIVPAVRDGSASRVAMAVSEA